MPENKFDSLEARILFAARISGSEIPISPTVENGVLEIVGTSKNDVILVTRENSGAAVPKGAKFAALFSQDGIVQQILLNGTTNKTVRLPSGRFIHLHTKDGEIYLRSGGITAITIDAGAGDDDVVVSTNVKLETTILGGDGNDTLEGSTKADSIDGGAGNDQIFGGKIGTAANTLIGSDGADTIIGSTIDDNIISPEDGAVDRITQLVSSSDIFDTSQNGFGTEDIIMRRLAVSQDSTFAH